MSRAPSHPVVHLELHTGNLPRACSFYTRLFGWRAETVHLGSSSYLSLGLGEAIDGGVVEDESERPLWLPYVLVPDIDAAAERAERLGGEITLDPREGPAGRWTVVSAPAGAEVALWQPRG